MFAKALGIWLYGLMCWLSPLQEAVDKSQHDPFTRETVEERDARYRGIVDAIVEVVLAPDAPLPFRGRIAVPASATLLLAVTWTESGWRRDIDLGKGPRSRGEGKDSCLAQVRVGKGATKEGWTHEDLTSDRVKCLTAALRLAKQSFGACKHLPHRHKLTAYAAGNCESSAGKVNSAAKLDLAARLLTRTKAPRPELPADVPAPATEARTAALQ